MARTAADSSWPLWYIEWIVRPHAMIRNALAKPERWMMAFGAVLVSGLALHIYYYTTVDYAWLGSSTIANASVTLTEDQMETVRRFMNPRTVLLIGGASLVLQHAIILLGLVGYFKLVSIAALGNVSFVPLFALASWARVPQILDDMAAAWRWSQADPQTLSFETLTPLSAGNLFPVLAETSVSQLSIIWLWVLVLIAAGLRYLMGMTWPISVFAAVLPFGILYAVNQLIISLA